MSERTDDRTAEGRASDADVDFDGLVDDAGGTTAAAGDVGVAEEDLGVDVDALTGDPDAGVASGGGPDADEPGLLSRLRPSLGASNPLGALPSPRSLGVSLGVVAVSMLLFGAVLPLGDVGSVLGIAAGSFLLGVASGRQRYLELVAAGAVAAAVSVVLGRLFLSAVAGLAVPLAAVGAGSGAAAALLGHYLGRDLRDGLTRDVE